MADLNENVFSERAFHYISNRVKAFIIVIFAALAVITALAFKLGAPTWASAALAVFTALLVLIFFFAVAKPYMREEQKIRMFLEGYSTPAGALTPEAENMFRRMQETMSSARVLTLNKRQAQYLALQNQINPHFLYNTLESIRSEALIAGVDSVADMTEALASFFRYTISKVETLVTVEEELQNCETYFYIQKFRFGDRLEMNIECDAAEKEDIFRCHLPKLTLQPILENSIIHGTEIKTGTGHLTIHLERSGTRVIIRVSDDGIGMNEATLRKMNESLAKSGKVLIEHEDESDGEDRDRGGKKGGIALVNVNNRIHLIFGDEYGIQVYSAVGIGTDVEISIPAITEGAAKLYPENKMAGMT